MIDFYIIPPRKALALSHLGDNRYFCLAQQYLKDLEYRKFFKDLPKEAWVTLDNGAGDHDIITEDELFEVMVDLMPNEVIPPDILFQGFRTICNAERFYQRMVEANLECKIEVFFCPQGSTQLDWLNCYKWALKQSWIKTIGLSKIAVPNAWLGVRGDVGIMEARHNCFNYLKVNDLLQKPIHLLGMGDPREFEYYAEHDDKKMIRSNDSCNAIWSAMGGYDWYEKEFERVPTPKNYFDLEVDSIDIEVIESNVRFLNKSVNK